MVLPCLLISGHHRVEAAGRLGVDTAPAWVEDFDDDEAYLQLVISNAQGELSPLEIGLHALRIAQEEGTSKGGRGNVSALTEYAGRIGRSRQSVLQLHAAAKVLHETAYTVGGLSALEGFADKTRHLNEIHSVKPETWPALVAWLAKGKGDKSCSIADVTRAVADHDSSAADRKSFLPTGRKLSTATPITPRRGCPCGGSASSSPAGRRSRRPSTAVARTWRA
jgi:hypothetical protein